MTALDILMLNMASIVQHDCNCMTAGMLIRLVKTIVNTSFSTLATEYGRHQYQYCRWKVSPMLIPV